jgi:general secretion pathway protein D
MNGQRWRDRVLTLAVAAVIAGAPALSMAQDPDDPAEPAEPPMQVDPQPQPEPQPVLPMPDVPIDPIPVPLPDDPPGPPGPQQPPQRSRVLGQDPPTTGTTPLPPRQGNGARTGAGGVQIADGQIMLNFENASIDVVLDELSAAAGFIVVKEVRPEGRVSLVSKQPISPTEAIDLLNTVLRKAGYVAIRQERILKIVSANEARRLNIPVRVGADPEKIPNTDELVTQVIPLKFANATQLKQDLEPLINPNADFASNASSNALMMTDTSANIRRVVEIVAALDTSVANAVSVKVFQLRFANAASAAQLVNSVFGQLDIGAADGSASGRPQQGGNNQGGGGGRGPGGGFGGGGNDPRAEFIRRLQQAQQGGGRAQTGNRITASADDRTNSVVVAGPAETLEIISTVMAELDSNPAAEETVFVYRLKNSQALNLESVLNGLFNGTSVNRSNTQQSQLNTNRNTNTRAGGTRGTGGTTGTPTIGGGGTTGGTRTTGGTTGQRTTQGGNFAGNQGRVTASAQQAASGLEGQVSIIADTDTNSLLIRTSPGNYDRVKAILDELDRPMRQVLIKVLIAEVTHDNGVDFGTEFSVLNLRLATDYAGNTVTRGPQGVTDFGIPNPGASNSGLVVQLLEQNFSATIRALETAGKLDVLSRPYILASDNQLASITVGQEVPFITNSRITDTGQTINTIEYGDVGILLDVVPQINPDGLVILDVAPEISTLTGTTVPISELVSAPVIAKRSAQSRVAVMSGQTVVIGGLMEDRVTQSVSKIPLLGDIPLLGELFKRTNTNKSKTELLIFLTPHVAADPRLLSDMSKDEVDGTKLVPNAVAPGVYDQHREGLERGAGYGPETLDNTTRPVEVLPPDQVPEQWRNQSGDRTGPRDGPRGQGEGPRGPGGGGAGGGRGRSGE